MRQVRYIFPISHHYRLPFHIQLRDLLESKNVNYQVVFSPPPRANMLKKDTVSIDWGVEVPVVYIPATNLVFQCGLGEALAADLVIIQQENRLLLNYVLNLLSMLGLKRIAYFGHGRNFQARDPKSFAERWKSFWALRVNWWFGYTDETRKHIESLGFPPEKITVFNNSVDTRAIHDLADAVTPERLAQRRAELGLHGGNVAIYVGGLYPDKRLKFLIAAALQTRQVVPDFELLIVGGGPDFEELKAMTAAHRWIHCLGPRFGADKIELMSLASLFVMPGLVGLAVLDAAAMGLPTVTTAFPWHSPEIAYLTHDDNGLIVAAWEDPQAYGKAVGDLLTDRPRLAAMQASARAMGERYSIEKMAMSFADGVMKALA